MTRGEAGMKGGTRPYETLGEEYFRKKKEQVPGPRGRNEYCVFEGRE